MTATNAARPVMFAGLARSRRWRDAAIVAVWLSIVGGFVAHVSTDTSSSRDTRALMATTAQPDAAARLQ
jgi:hypothetical protein